MCDLYMSHYSLYFYIVVSHIFFLFFFNAPPTPEIYTLSLHDALPICRQAGEGAGLEGEGRGRPRLGERRPRLRGGRSEEHTSELQSRFDLVCRLLLEKKKKK